MTQRNAAQPAPDTGPSPLPSQAIDWTPARDAPPWIHGAYAMLHPRNIVLLGATEKPGSFAQRIWGNLQKSGFAGRVLPMNINRDEVWGTRCYRGWQALPEPPDHVVVLLPPGAVAGALREAAAAGARSATIISAGFDEEDDPEAQARARDLRAALAETGLAATGPNCLGNFSAPAGLFTNIESREIDMTCGAVGIVGQSGALTMMMRQAFQARGIDLRYVVSTGNEAGLRTTDFIDYYAADPGVRLIVAYLEAVGDRDRFLAACRAARAAGKPVIALKLGMSDGGRAAAMAHTGSLAGAIGAFDAATRPTGLIRVASLDEMIETADCFLHTPPPRGVRLAGVSISGAKRGLMIDSFSAAGFDFAPFGAATCERLREALGPRTPTSNPLDAGYTAPLAQSAYIRAIEAVLADTGVDMLAVDSDFPHDPNAFHEANIREIDDLAGRAGKPVFLINAVSAGFSRHTRAIRAGARNVAFLQGAPMAAAAIRHFTDRALLPRAVEVRVPPTPPGVLDRLGRLLAEARGPALDEAVSKTLLADYGIEVSREGIATTAEEALRLAGEIGYPVAAKIVSPDIAHKSDMGGVRLNLGNAAELREAYDGILAAAVEHAPDARIEGVLVAQMVRGDLELVLGASWDPEMGPVVMFGTGGVDIELVKDVALGPVPLGEEAARALIGRTRAGVRMAGYRGRPRLDEGPVVRALLGLSRLIADGAGRIASVDINPLMLSGTGAVAVDGLIVLSDARD